MLLWFIVFLSTVCLTINYQVTQKYKKVSKIVLFCYVAIVNLNYRKLCENKVVLDLFFLLNIFDNLAVYVFFALPKECTDFMFQIKHCMGIYFFL